MRHIAAAAATRSLTAQRSTVTSYIEGTVHNSRFCLSTSDEDRHAFSIRTEDVESLSRLKACEGIATQAQYLFRTVIKVTPVGVILQLGVVGIGIRTVTTTIDVTIDMG